MSEIVPQHSHCQVCGKTIPVTETLCSQECKDKYQIMIKRRRLMVYIMYGLIGVILIVMLLFSNI
jgi:predicted nucleic acid-binding Zn ribbon protein